jgi:predicted RecB family nuclease
MATAKTLRTCPKGHRYYKSSDCPTCPTCEAEKNSTPFFEGLSAPARRALENAGITTAKKLASFSKKEILDLHGMGPASLPALTAQLKKYGLDFKKPGS